MCWIPVHGRYVPLLSQQGLLVFPPNAFCVLPPIETEIANIDERDGTSTINNFRLFPKVICNYYFGMHLYSLALHL